MLIWPPSVVVMEMGPPEHALDRIVEPGLVITLPFTVMVIGAPFLGFCRRRRFHHR